ncbi:MAG: PorP/SprF family type IX secretion system membrane protein [Sphingobacteriaceae bacterium]
MKKSILLLVYLTLPLLVAAQLRVQRSISTQYQFNGLSINPAFSASDNQGRVTALSRHQWVGFDGAPQTQTLSAYITLPNEKTSVGATFVNDKLGVESEQAFFLSLAQKVRVSEKGYFAAGFSGGIGYYLGNYGDIAVQDPIFVNQSSWRGSLGLGVYYFTDHFDLGLSTPYLVKFDVGASTSTTSIKPLRSDYFLTSSYRFRLNDFILLKPSTLLKYTPGVPMQIDANLNAYFDQQGLWIGLGYRSNTAILAMFQVKLSDRIQLGYSHDFATNLTLKHQLGTHEVMLNYRFGSSKKPYNASDFRF